MNRLTSNIGYIERLRGVLTATPPVNDEASDKIAKWLAELRLLHGVPFQYLIPDQRMLPPESVRFFKIDENWINCLIDGAFSIGRSTTGDAQRDAAKVEHMTKRAALTAPKLRARRFGLAMAEDGDDDDPTGFSASGFLLRSGVVSGWPGMEVRGYEPGNTTEVPKVRFERVASDILFCLFERQITKVVLSEPAEILHFGLPIPDKPTDPYIKLLKWVKSGGPSHPPGSEMKGVSVRVSLSDKRVLDISTLAGQIHDTLKQKNGIDPNAPYTPAEFGLEMVQGVQEVDFHTPAEASPGGPR
jgi:hypothetical protein